jgi:hypothetical protein
VRLAQRRGRSYNKNTMFPRLPTFLAVTLLAALMASSLNVGIAAPASFTFENDVQPILKAHCFHCHGELVEHQGELDLRLARLILTGGASGPAIVKGQPDQSLLLEYLRDGTMPPADVTHRPTDAEITIIRKWVAGGALTVYEEPESLGDGFYITPAEREFWAFQKIQRPELPQLFGGLPAENGIDHFIGAKLAASELTFSPRAEKTTLLRRATLDLTGLPPTPAALGKFKNSRNPAAYEELVDQLLASVSYGERWGRHWLDAAGYADSEGYTDSDAQRPWAFKYRDYVIASFNKDKPYNQFILEQLAGDELVGKPLENLTPQQQELIVATGFLRNAPDGTGSGAATEEARNAVVSETIKQVTSSLVGLTVGCAQCHNHRYDPISQKDYYRLRAVFEPALNWKAWKTPAHRRVSLYTEADRQRKAEVESQIKEIATQRSKKQEAYIVATFESEIAKLPSEVQAEVRTAHDTAEKERSDAQNKLIKKYPSTVVTAGNLYLFDKKAAADLATFTTKQETLRKAIPLEEYVRCLTEPHQQSPPTTFVFSRGNFSAPLVEVEPRELTVLDPQGTASYVDRIENIPTTGRRYQYAQWLTSAEHPLLARVIVNRIWAHHFGRGIVDTPGDFGALGGRPSHPQLLDWLAAELMQNDWSIKHIHRLIMTSTTYQQSSTRHELGNKIDRQKRMLWSMPVRRLETESIRDTILAISGMLNTQATGAAVPVMADRTGQWIVGKENLNAGRPGPVIDMLGQQYRRSVYIEVRRSRPLAVLEPFDLPTLSPNCNRRASSTVAPQSLQMLNSEFITQQSRHFADRLLRLSDSAEDRIRAAWRLVYSKEITAEQFDEALDFIGTSEKTLTADYQDKGIKDDAQRDALALLCQALISSNQFIYIE